MAAKREWFEMEQDGDPVLDARGLDMTHNSVRFKDGTRLSIGRDSRSLPNLVRFMHRTIRTGDPAFKIIVANGRKKVIAASSLAGYFGTLHAMAALYSRAVHYSPLLRLFFECFARHEIRHCILNGPTLQFDGDRIEAEVFGDFLVFLREQGESQDTVAQTNNWESISDGNEKRLQRYIESQFEHHDVLIPVDMELFYAKSCVDESRLSEIETALAQEAVDDMDALYGREIGGGEHEFPTDFDASQLVKDRDRLLDNMRKKPSIFGDMVGCVWRIEWSRIGGYYLRVVFLFAGSRNAVSPWLAGSVGEYWVNTITKGQGQFRYLNHSIRESEDGPWRTWSVTCRDEAKIEAMMRFFRSMARRERYVSAKPIKKCKRFGMGRVLKAMRSPPNTGWGWGTGQ
ncbi:DUF3296 domain-containing protein [Trinickia dinghuensis]|uniref:DUF3296 domain-containing protein n=1 Tax=Trinickia dinghuensis TaxID=2291023 RepID=A0A3D8JQ69_9BURK|nr:DUF3296 domain-containing protein [Trinickia dinghuensis]RDU94952.1 DUF3296 domain-containing protein [Trinickia dinghuensis]